jgi:uncharacterized protein YcnI
MPSLPRAAAVLALIAQAVAATPAEAQVAIHPTAVAPASWERFGLRVVSQYDSPVVSVRLLVPDALAVLGVDAPPGWTAHHIAATDSTPQAIEWTGSRVERGEFREFAFLGRLAADARRKELVFPVHLTRADGSTLEWSRDGAGAPLVVLIRGTTRLSPWGALAAAGAAIGLASLAMVLALLALWTRP